MIAIEPTTRIRYTRPAKASRAGTARSGSAASRPEQLELVAVGGDLDSLAVQHRAGAALGAELLASAEVVDVAELDFRHRVAAGDGEAEAVRGQGAAGVERAVDRVDHDPGWAAAAELDLAALLGDGDEGGALRCQRVELGEDDVLAAAVDDQGAIAALADALVLGARLDPAHLFEDRPLRAHGAAADSQPVCGENVHAAHPMEAAHSLALDHAQLGGGAAARGATRWWPTVAARRRRRR